jgi:hypothetical protein
LGEVLLEGDDINETKFILTRNKWTMRNPANNMNVFTPTTQRAYPALDTTVTCYFEGQFVAQIRKEETYQYDTYGRIKKQTTTSTDMPLIEIAINYNHPLPGNYNINVPSEVIVRSSGQDYRKRTTVINTTTGQLTFISDYFNNWNTLTASMTYDQYGNCTKIQYPSHSITVDYEKTLHTYPESITNDFGETSWRLNYDLRFGIPLKTKDIYGSETHYTLDEWGRIATVCSPKEIDSLVPYTIKYEYFGKYCPYDTSLCTPYMARTRNYDVQHPDNDIETYTFCDGLGRIVQTKVDASVNGEEKMIVSGKIVYDALGRIMETYLPSVCDTADTLFTTIAIAPVSISTYDILDRPLLQIAHDGTTVSYNYDFGHDSWQWCTLFKTEVMDQNGYISTNLTNVDGRQYEMQAAGHQPVWFIYNPVGDLMEVWGVDFNRNYNYDMLGRRT